MFINRTQENICFAVYFEPNLKRVAPSEFIHFGSVFTLMFHFRTSRRLLWMSIISSSITVKVLVWLYDVLVLGLQSQDGRHLAGRGRIDLPRDVSSAATPSAALLCGCVLANSPCGYWIRSVVSPLLILRISLRLIGYLKITEFDPLRNSIFFREAGCNIYDSSENN